jgi:hypothetical protein
MMKDNEETLAGMEGLACEDRLAIDATIDVLIWENLRYLRPLTMPATLARMLIVPRMMLRIPIAVRIPGRPAGRLA